MLKIRYIFGENSNIVVAGEFNKLAIEKVTLLEEKYRLKRVTPEGVPTHKEGIR